MLRNPLAHENNRKSREKPILWSFLRLRDIFTRIFFLLLKTRQIFVWFHFASIFSIFVRKNFFRCFKEQETWTFACGVFVSDVLKASKCKDLLEHYWTQLSRNQTLLNLNVSQLVNRSQCYIFVIFVHLNTRKASETVHHVFSIVFCEFNPFSRAAKWLTVVKLFKSNSPTHRRKKLFWCETATQTMTSDGLIICLLKLICLAKEKLFASTNFLKARRKYFSKSVEDNFRHSKRQKKFLNEFFWYFWLSKEESGAPAVRS